MVATSTESPTVQFLSADGRFSPTPAAEQYASYLDEVDEAQHRSFYREMAVVRRFDTEAANLQRQGQLGLWVPSHGQEAAQVGSAFAMRPQDHVFPSYREHVVGKIRGIDLLGVLALLRGTTHGGWDPTDPTNGNFHLYTLVLGSQALHATGYAMGLTLDGATGTGDPEKDAAVVVYFGDGASSQGDVSEAMVFAASYQAPEVFFLQNNHYAISVPVATQSRSPLYLRSSGFGIPGVQIDGNDVLASYAVTAKHLQDARSGGGPQFIEALTYRIGAHTSSDDPTKYRTDDELASWVAKDPITRFAAYLRSEGVEQSFFDEVDEEAKDFASDIRRRLLALEVPPTGVMFDHVYSEPHVLVEEQKAWLQRYEESFGGE
ncbi:pyruvate dehydrogenase (acetyl-transferring) E1 component subunit alpha [Rathayibacter sp. AY1B1]|uniref:thiamine pyrophosphate-dependent dehydrogenase E1 component subunit alpha n=1 Tax=unclassified Rathayibacter TaxID=2609250 RepID=UPI000CE7EC3A|nr:MULTISPECIES: thiamine pyrophosphate-dependent dehydrogenase E1 component subunit alpha [unclassified Rathayibacter]PPI23896.1 pyruvate dehydrogenase (acetyl-transferring) E1 component subunit alpha [Rathayibacter sp. AY1B6]PPI28017.1 pyruvate dehydrogenase (acetyl-transferring) E1 component subunit alpha [Rathayibacter sp. AY1B1]